ncbi:ATP-binding protein [Zoogloea dura]|uniref:ATP-binding protein n=1 Tax=Zoogloea dura TaxID=2728840 RepID=UPI0019817A79|nr:ATP-binding protein [Zoogloea dura]
MAIVGLAATIHPVTARPAEVAVALGMGVLSSLLLVSGRSLLISRGRGLMLLAAYALCVAALGNQACRQGLTVTFVRLPLLLEELAISHGDGSFCKRLSALAKVDLLILDDFGISVLNAIGRNDLLEVIEQRTGHRSTLITSQLPVDRWHDYLSGGNPTMADAILDRLVSGAHRLDLKGDSMRRLKRKNDASSI